MFNWEDYLHGELNGLDISPSMYQTAEQRYKAVASSLVEHGLSCDIYPQGSFATGTVIRPYRDDKDQNFDIDMVCEIKIPKHETTPIEVHTSVHDGLTSHASRLSAPMKTADRCFTLEYADDSSGIGFNLDIVPSVRESEEEIQSIEMVGIAHDKAVSAIAITELIGQKKDNAKWIPSNPKGYASWFGEINEPFREYSRMAERTRIFRNNSMIYASVEEVPPQLERSSLQRVCQILKRHRDVYYCRRKATDIKPASVIITTLVAHAAKSASPRCGIEELLRHVIQRILYSENLLSGDYLRFASMHMDVLLLSRNESKWQLRNPVNPNDNYTDSWTNKNADMFFAWLKAVQQDFLDGSSHSESIVEARMLSALGLKVISSDDRKGETREITPSRPTNLQVVQPIKPWKE